MRPEELLQPLIEEQHEAQQYCQTRQPTDTEALSEYQHTAEQSDGRQPSSLWCRGSAIQPRNIKHIVETAQHRDCQQPAVCRDSDQGWQPVTDAEPDQQHHPEDSMRYQETVVASMPCSTCLSMIGSTPQSSVVVSPTGTVQPATGKDMHGAFSIRRGKAASIVGPGRPTAAEVSVAATRLGHVAKWSKRRSPASGIA